MGGKRRCEHEQTEPEPEVFSRTFRERIWPTMIPRMAQMTIQTEKQSYPNVNMSMKNEDDFIDKKNRTFPLEICDRDCPLAKQIVPT